MSFGALLDACVLVPASLADTLLRAAEAGLYRPLWSAEILREVRSAVLEVHPEIAPTHVDARLTAMQSAFEDATVLGWEPLVDGIVLGGDPDDFLLDLADLDPPTMVAVIESQSRGTGRPPLSPGQVLDSLGRAGTPGFAASMRPLLGLSSD
ncbi:PIN domain-containing protein [Cellulomonas olei]|uniref:PIN domain-containing protein n=1 Tax=Cellulomonas sp. P4 TaxID=3142533 RepID=UPI0031BA077B